MAQGGAELSLNHLPDDVLFDIVGHLDTAQDVASVACSSRRTRDLVHQNGWREFVRKSFPSLKVTAEDPGDWAFVANRLTYLDRCWEKRGIFLSSFAEQRPNRPRGRWHPRQQTVRFHPVVDVRSVSRPQDELLAWGAGENLVFRWKKRGTADSESWGQLLGLQAGYAAGFGDVTAISVLERQYGPEVIVGRANGDLQFLSGATEYFGQSVQELMPHFEAGSADASAVLRRSPGQTAISWTEWEPRSQLLASCQSSVVTLYDLQDAGAARLSPIAYYDTSTERPDDEICLVRSAKFMGKDTIVCALGSSRQPLRWGRILPTGIEFFNASSNTNLVDTVSAKTDIASGEKTIVRAIEPVGDERRGDLLLGAWDDGTYRLMDIRTPSAYDAIFRDQFQPYQSGSSLLVYGTERFVVGSNSQPDLRFFDFRYPKAYHHTKAQACSAYSPFPNRPYDSGKSSYTETLNRLKLGPDGERCDHLHGYECSWHHQSKADSWRPDATLHLGNPDYDSIFSLSKSSDMSDTFYCGVRGGVVEATISLAEDWHRERPTRTAPPGWRMTSERREARLMETGTSLCTSEYWRGANAVGLPRMLYHQNPWSVAEGERDVASPRSRLDSAWRTRSGSLPP